MRKPCFLSWAIIFALSFLAFPASAIQPIDAMNMFGTEHGDGFSSVFLNQIFGPIFPSVAGGSTATVFSIIVGYFNVIILVVGGILFFYNATVGLLQSAHEGQVLGQRWSSLWAPLRILFAVGLLVPVPNLGGYNLVQAGVAYVVKGSTNVASAIWVTSADLVLNGDVSISAPPPTLPAGVIRTLYGNAACEAILNHQMAAAAGSSGTPFRVVDQAGTGQDGIIRTSSALNMNGTVTQHGICGSRSTPALPSYITNIAGEARVVVPGIPEDARPDIAAFFSTMHENVLNQAMNDMRAITGVHLQTMLDNGQPLPDIANTIELTVLSANANLEQGNRSIMDAAIGVDRQGGQARQALMNRIRGTCSETVADRAAMTCYGEGWIGAGSWYMMFAQINNELSSLLAAQPSAFEGMYIGHPDPVNRQIHIASGGSRWSSNDNLVDATGIQLAMDRYMQTFDTSTAGLAALGFSVAPAHLSQMSDTNPSSILQRIPGFNQWLTETRNGIIEVFSPGNRWHASDPMVGMSTLGSYLITGAGILLAVAGVTGFISGGAVATMVMPLFVAALTAGSILHLLLPIMPFIFWILAVTGYFILVVEAMIAVNLWAIAHMRMDGDGISGEAGRNGWLMLLALLLTPVLMIFGFLIGMTIFRVTSALLDIGIFQALSGILGGNLWINLIAIFSYAIFMCIFYMVLLERSFSLVSEFPGRVLRWMGANAQLTNGEENKVRLAAAGAGMAVARGSTTPAGALIRGAGAAGISRAGGSGNPSGDPSRYGATRRAAERWNTSPGEGDGPVRRAVKSIGRGVQGAIGVGPNSMGPDSGRRGPPRSSG